MIVKIGITDLAILANLDPETVSSTAAAELLQKLIVWLRKKLNPETTVEVKQLRQKALQGSVMTFEFVARPDSARPYLLFSALPA